MVVDGRRFPSNYMSFSLPVERRILHARVGQLNPVSSPVAECSRKSSTDFFFFKFENVASTRGFNREVMAAWFIVHFMIFSYGV